MKRAVSCVLLGAAALSSANAAAAQPQTSSNEPQTITVTGNRNAKQEIRDFVKALTPVTFDGQLSRFEHSVCPAVFGLAKPQAEAVEERIRAVAKSVDIVVSGPGCAPNVFLLVTSDKKKMIHELWVHASQYFDSGHQATALERQEGPAAAWGIGGPPINARGEDLHRETVCFGPTCSAQYVNRTTEAASRITEAARPQFDAAVVVVEKKALVGMTTTQLADYAAIRALTGADPAKLANSNAPTILNVLNVPVGAEAPITMTKWDFAFLKGYYDARPTLRTGARRSAIADEMDKTIHNPQN